MALPLLPPEHIRPVFNHYKPTDPTEPLQQLYSYTMDTWISDSTWTPVDWSVFGVAVRTNNDQTPSTACPRTEAHQSPEKINKEGQLRHLHPLDGV